MSRRDRAAGTRPAEELIDDCDVLLVVGTNFTCTEHLPKPGTVAVVQIDTDHGHRGGRLGGQPLEGSSEAA